MVFHHKFKHCLDFSCAAGCVLTTPMVEKNIYLGTLCCHQNLFKNKLYICTLPLINPLVPTVQKTKICNLTLNRLPLNEFVKKLVYLGAHYSERQG